MSTFKCLSPLLIAVFSLQLNAQTLPNKSFDEIWSLFYQKSLQKKSLEAEQNSYQLSLQRAQRHWIPRAYFQGQWFSTNDPGQVFFNNLGQRAISQMDFIPRDLNHPERSQFKMGTLGIDFPLFEGGMKKNQTTMFENIVRASQRELEAKKTEEYAELAKKFGALLVYSQSYEHLIDLRNNLKKVISSYQVGSQSNPVGYSGLLGLKGVENRIEGMLSEYDLHRLNEKDWISEKSEISPSWNPEKISLKPFIEKHFTSSAAYSFSSMILTQEEKLKTLDSVTEMEKARFLPRVGLFAQNNLYSGERETSSSEAFGLYIQWDLFNNDSYGRVDEAKAKSLAARMKLDHYKKEEKIMLSKLKESHKTLKKNLLLLNDSDRLLKEQSQNAMKLFKSGMLTALQLAELINRRVDLIVSQTQAEIQYLEVSAGLYQIHH